MAQWVEVSLRVDGEAAEALAYELQRWCHQGVAVEYADLPQDKLDEDQVPPPEMLIVRGYFAHDDRTPATQQAINQAIGYMNMLYPMPQPVYHIVDDEDWGEAWKKHYHPVRIGRRILIRPAWIDLQPQPEDVVIALDPGMAFGTGTHPTTQLCLEALEDLMQPGLDVIDLGCGSGILAIAAAKMQAAKVVAVDIDPLAVKITGENAAANGVAALIQAHTGSLETLITSARRFDLALVNILARTIIAMCAEHLGDLVRPGGRAIFSGIIHDQADDVEAALRRTGLLPVARRQQGDWVLIEARRPPAE
ncbi:MAG: 50S ribosomal protein L11 methyltransferase [Anaerolineae bacterium]|jgi:ribosomal protein L11 methyltransferase|nr:50S ribosomal protein L11 methyltransferase [Anaerolineae bacterium]